MKAANGVAQSEPKVKAASPQEQQREAERVTLRRRRYTYPASECTVGELLKRLFDDEGLANPDLAECAIDQVVADLYVLAIAVETGKDALDAETIGSSIMRIRSRLEIASELSRRDRRVNAPDDAGGEEVVS